MEADSSSLLCSQLHSLGDRQHLFRGRTFKQLTYCNVCESLLWGLANQGLQCLVCRFVCHSKCEAAALSAPLCKSHESAASEPSFSLHHWVRGNLRLLHGLPICPGCQGVVPVSVSPVGLGTFYRCSQCNAKVHADCIAALPRHCDGGALGSATLLRHHLIRQPDGTLVPHVSPALTPLVVFVNSRSGSAQGEDVIKTLIGHLNKFQLWDLADGGPQRGLALFARVPGVRVVACGGDGTFGWVQSAIDALQPECRPAVAHLPLGTANDMSRSLGWGPGLAATDSVLDICHRMARADVALLDRWRVTFDGQPHGYTPAMNNYFSVGCDASVAHGFHVAREADPAKFSNRGLNKLKYVQLAATTTVRGFNRVVTLYCDDAEVALSDTCQSVVVMNLTSYAAGQKLWDDTETSEFGRQGFGDGLLEVVSLRSAADVGLAAVGIKPARLAQCKRVRLVMVAPLAVQLDGEPWEQDPCTIEISLLNQVPVLVRSKVAEGKSTVTTSADEEEGK